MKSSSRSRALALAAVLLAGVPAGVHAQVPPFPLVPPPPPPPPGEPDAPPIAAPTPVVPAEPNEAPAAPAPPTPNTQPNTDATNPAPTAAPSGVRLRYKFAAGQTLRYRMTVDADGTVAAASGTGTPIKQHMVMTLHQTVRGIRASDGAATLAVQVDSVVLSINGRDIPLPAQALDRMKQVFTTTMTPTGKLVDFKGPTGASPVGGMRFNPADFQNLRALPDGSVDKGATWNSKFAAPTGFVTASVKYTLDDLARDSSLATIGQKIWAEIKPPKATAGAPAAAKVAGLVTGTGRETFDVDAGAVNSQTNAITVRLTITPPRTARPGAPASTKANFTINSDLERVTDGGTGGAKAAPPAPADEPPTGQLQ